MNLAQVGKLTFGYPDLDTFSLLSSAFHAAKLGGALPAVLNAANEVAVSKFLSGNIKFRDITNIVNEVFYSMESAKNIHTLDEILLTDKMTREITEKMILSK